MAVALQAIQRQLAMGTIDPAAISSVLGCLRLSVRIAAAAVLCASLQLLAFGCWLSGIKAHTRRCTEVARPAASPRGGAYFEWTCWEAPIASVRGSARECRPHRLRGGGGESASVLRPPPHRVPGCMPASDPQAGNINATHRLRVLQSLTLIMTAQSVRLGSSSIAEALSICCKMLDDEDGSVARTAEATLRQLVPSVFDRLARETAAQVSVQACTKRCCDACGDAECWSPVLFLGPSWFLSRCCLGLCGAWVGMRIGTRGCRCRRAIIV